MAGNLPRLQNIKLDPFLESYAPSYIENRKKDFVTLQGLLNKKKFKQIEKLSHKIAGSAGTYGFQNLSLIGNQLEDAAHNRSFEKIEVFLHAGIEYLDGMKFQKAQ